MFWQSIRNKTSRTLANISNRSYITEVVTGTIVSSHFLELMGIEHSLVVLYCNIKNSAFGIDIEHLIGHSSPQCSFFTTAIVLVYQFS